MSARTTSALFTGMDLLQLDHTAALGFERPAEVRVHSVSTDSRRAEQESVFVALRGSTFDGHNFLTKAVAQGARALILERTWAENNPPLLASLVVPRLIVEDCTRALGQLARLHRRKFRIPVLAVAGSNGKTTTKDMIVAVLSERYNVLGTEGNLNNHVGVPQTLFRLDASHDIAVVEIGTNHFGELAYLCDILEPTHGLITNIGSEHLEFFKNLSGVTKAEGELIEWLNSRRAGKGVVFLNRDDPRLVRIMRTFRKKKISYSLKSRAADVRASLVPGPGDRSVLRVTPRGKRPFDCRLEVVGGHNAINALAATAVGLSLKVAPKLIQHALQIFHAPSKRMETLSIAGVTILNDTYNSNPDSVRAALETLHSVDAPGKRIAVLADMLELGAASEREHRAIARLVKRAGVTYLLTYGPMFKLTHDASTVRFKAHYDQKNVLAEYLSELLSKGDVVLVKGSRGMKMEDVVTFVRERLARDPTSRGERAA